MRIEGRTMKRAIIKRGLTREELEAERARRKEVTADFIRIELELADTFCKLALESRSPERIKQNQFNAQRAIDTAMQSLARIQLNADEGEQIVIKLEEVKAMLDALKDERRGAHC